MHNNIWLRNDQVGWKIYLQNNFFLGNGLLTRQNRIISNNNYYDKSNFRALPWSLVNNTLLVNINPAIISHEQWSLPTQINRTSFLNNVYFNNIGSAINTNWYRIGWGSQTGWVVRVHTPFPWSYYRWEYEYSSYNNFPDILTPSNMIYSQTNDWLQWNFDPWSNNFSLWLASPTLTQSNGIWHNRVATPFSQKQYWEDMLWFPQREKFNERDTTFVYWTTWYRENSVLDTYFGCNVPTQKQPLTLSGSDIIFLTWDSISWSDQKYVWENIYINSMQWPCIDLLPEVIVNNVVPLGSIHSTWISENNIPAWFQVAYWANNWWYINIWNWNLWAGLNTWPLAWDIFAVAANTFWTTKKTTFDVWWMRGSITTTTRPAIIPSITNIKSCDDNISQTPFFEWTWWVWDTVEVFIAGYWIQTTIVDNSEKRSLTRSGNLATGKSYTVFVRAREPGWVMIPWYNSKWFVVWNKNSLTFIDDARRATNPSDDELKEKLYGCHTPYTQYRDGNSCDITTLTVTPRTPSQRWTNLPVANTLSGNTIYVLDGQYDIQNTITFGACTAIVNKPWTVHTSMMATWFMYIFQTPAKAIVDWWTFRDGLNIPNTQYSTTSNIVFGSHRYFSLNNLSFFDISVENEGWNARDQYTNSLFINSFAWGSYGAEERLYHNNIYYNTTVSYVSQADTHAFNNIVNMWGHIGLYSYANRLRPNLIRNSYISSNGINNAAPNNIFDSNYFASTMSFNNIYSGELYGKNTFINARLADASMIWDMPPYRNAQTLLSTWIIETNLYAPARYWVFLQYQSGWVSQVLFSGNMNQRWWAFGAVTDPTRLPQDNSICLSYGDLALRQKQPYQRTTTPTNNSLTGWLLSLANIPYVSSQYVWEFNNNRCLDTYPETFVDFTDLYNVPLNTSMQTPESNIVSDIIEAASVFVEPSYSAIIISTWSLNTWEIFVPMMWVRTTDASAANSWDTVRLRQQSANMFSTTTTVSYNVWWVQGERFVQTRPAVIPTLTTIKNISPDPVNTFWSGSDMIFTWEARSWDTVFFSLSWTIYSWYTASLVATWGIWNLVLPSVLPDGEYTITLTAREPWWVDIPWQSQYKFFVDNQPNISIQKTSLQSSWTVWDTIQYRIDITNTDVFTNTFVVEDFVVQALEYKDSYIQAPSGTTSWFSTQTVLATGTHYTRDIPTLAPWQTASVFIETEIVESFGKYYQPQNYSWWAYNFGAPEDYVFIPNSRTWFYLNDTYTISHWVNYPAPAPSYQYFPLAKTHCWWSPKNRQIQLNWSEYNTWSRWFIWFTDWEIIDITAKDENWNNILFPNNWRYNITVVIDNGTASLYLNNNLMWTDTYSWNFSTANNLLTIWTTDCVVWMNHFSFNWQIADVRIFDEVKDLQQREQIMKWYPDTDWLLARYKTDEWSGTTVYDSSGNWRHWVTSAGSEVRNTVNSWFHSKTPLPWLSEGLGYTLSGSVKVPRDENNPLFSVLWDPLSVSPSFGYASRYNTAYATFKNATYSSQAPVEYNPRVEIAMSATLPTEVFPWDIVTWTVIVTNNWPDWTRFSFDGSILSGITFTQAWIRASGFVSDEIRSWGSRTYTFAWYFGTWMAWMIIPYTINTQAYMPETQLSNNQAQGTIRILVPDTTAPICTVTKNINWQSVNVWYTSNEDWNAMIVCNWVTEKTHTITAWAYNRSTTKPVWTYTCDVQLTDWSWNIQLCPFTFDSTTPIVPDTKKPDQCTPKDYSPSRYDGTCVCTTNCPKTGGWGWWGVTKDNCPNWDFSKSYYDNTCGKPTIEEPKPEDDFHGSAPKQSLSAQNIIDAYLPITTCFYTDVDYGKILFRDITYNVYRKDIESLVDFCIVKWKKPNIFAPKEYITKAEFAKIITKVTLLGERNDHDISYLQRSQTPFVDVTSEKRHAVYVQKMIELWRLFPWGEFNPKDNASASWVKSTILQARNYAQKQQPSYKLMTDQQTKALRKNMNDAYISRWVISHRMSQIFDLRTRASHSAVRHVALRKKLQTIMDKTPNEKQHETLNKLHWFIQDYSEQRLWVLDINKAIFLIEIQTVIASLDYTKESKKEILSRIYAYNESDKKTQELIVALRESPEKTLERFAPTLYKKNIDPQLVAIFLENKQYMK